MEMGAADTFDVKVFSKNHIWKRWKMILGSAKTTILTTVFKLKNASNIEDVFNS